MAAPGSQRSRPCWRLLRHRRAPGRKCGIREPGGQGVMTVVTFRRVWPTLKTTREAGDFTIWSVGRNQPHGPGHGARGIRYAGIVENYRRTLRWLRGEWKALHLAS